VQLRIPTGARVQLARSFQRVPMFASVCNVIEKTLITRNSVQLAKIKTIIAKLTTTT